MRESKAANCNSKCPKCQRYTMSAGYCPPCDYTKPSDKCPCTWHKKHRS